jgi:hypothetical protein
MPLFLSSEDCLDSIQDKQAEDLEVRGDADEITGFAREANNAFFRALVIFAVCFFILSDLLGPDLARPHPQPIKISLLKSDCHYFILIRAL